MWRVLGSVLGISLASASAGCGGDGRDAAPDAGALSDASSAKFALRVGWTARPALPGVIDNDITVTSATFNIGRLQVLGDAGGGEGTTRTGINLSWSGTAQDPPPTVFPMAPAGLYSQVHLDVDSGLGISYELTGTARIGGTPAPFRINDVQPLVIEIEGYDVMLAAGHDAMIPVIVDLTGVLEDLNFSQFTDEDGVRTLDHDDAQIDDVRDALVDAFRPGS